MPGLNFNSPPTAEVEHPLDSLLEDARMAASTDWEEQFVADMTEKRKKYGSKWHVSVGQERKLRQIAEKEDSEDRWFNNDRLDRSYDFDDDISF